MKRKIINSISKDKFTIREKICTLKRIKPIHVCCNIAENCIRKIVGTIIKRQKSTR